MDGMLGLGNAVNGANDDMGALGGALTRSNGKFMVAGLVRSSF